MRYVFFALALFITFAPLTTHAAFEFVQIVPAECKCDEVYVENAPAGSEPVPSAPAWGCVLQTIQNVIRVGIALALVVATLALIYAGFVWMTSGGNPERRNQGSHLLLNVFVGIFVILGAWLLVDFVMKTLAGEQTGGFGPWNNILGPNGESGDFCLVARNPQPIATGVVGLVTDVITGQPGGSAGGSSGEAIPSRNLTNQAAVSLLQSAGVSVKAGASLQGTLENTVNQVIALRQACGCSITVTSGTDGSHAGGAISHGTGYKVDLRLNNTLNSYIQSLSFVGRRSNGDPRYRDRCGNEYVLESDHWDITVSRGVCSPPR